MDNIVSNPKISPSNPYPYLPILEDESSVCFFDPESLEPLCAIPPKARTWALLHFIAAQVAKSTAQGKKAGEIRKEVELSARAFNKQHLEGKTLIRTIKHGVRTSMAYQAMGMNSRAHECWEVDANGRRVTARRFSHKPKWKS